MWKRSQRANEHDNPTVCPAEKCQSLEDDCNIETICRAEIDKAEKQKFGEQVALKKTVAVMEGMQEEE